MILRKWDNLPESMKTDAVRHYYLILEKKKPELFLKRVADILISVILLLAFFPGFLFISLIVHLDSKGPVFFRQTRITQYNTTFRIFKFRTMKPNSDSGSQVTVKDDDRITKVGAFLRKYRIDEISQLIDVVRGKMTLVGTRPEVPLYTEKYTEEMMATLLLPAGVTSLASIYYKDEEKLLSDSDDTDRVYIEEILPEKMKYNLKAIENFSLLGDIKIMMMTILAVLGKDYK